MGLRICISSSVTIMSDSSIREKKSIAYYSDKLVVTEVQVTVSKLAAETWSGSESLHPSPWNHNGIIVTWLIWLLDYLHPTT